MAPERRSPDPVELSILAAREGSLDALGSALEAFRDYLLLLANRDLDADIRPRVAPSDLVQQTFGEAVQDFAQFDGDRECELRLWLVRIYRNNLANVRAYHRAAKRSVDRDVPLPDGSGPLPTPDSATVSARARAEEDAARLQAAILLLPPRYRLAIELHNQEHLSFEVVGTRMDCSAEAARKLWVRAVEKLQAILEPGDGHRIS